MRLGTTYLLHYSVSLVQLGLSRRGLFDSMNDVNGTNGMLIAPKTAQMLPRGTTFGATFDIGLGSLVRTSSTAPLPC